MNKYTKLAADIIENVGGKENIIDLKHCVTRLRFTLKDESIANDEILKNMDGVITVVKAMNQYMVVIGEHVADVFDEVMLQLDLKPQESKGESISKKGFLNWCLGKIMAATGPILNYLCACGIIKGITIISTMFGLSDTSAVYQLLNAAGDCLFYFLPIVLGYNVAKDSKIDPFMGVLLAAALEYPTIQGVDLNFFGYVVNVTYTSSFLPIFFGLIIAVPLYKFFIKKLPNVVKGFLTPVIVLLVAFPITYIVLGPLANMLGTIIDNCINFFLVETPILGSIVVGFIWQILVMFGMHAIPSTVAFYNLLAGKPTALLAVTGNVCFAVCGTLFAVAIKSKDKELKSSSASSLFSAALGVTEPAMYGIIIPRKILLITTCLGGAVTGLIVGLFKLKLYSYTGLGIFGLLGMIGSKNTNILAIALVVILPLIASFVITYILYKDETEKNKTEVKNTNSNIQKKVDSTSSNVITIKMPLNGKVEALESCVDEAFAQEALGKGCLIIPKEGKVYAPISGVVKTVFPTKHAIGIVSDNGLEVLIHIGINTVNLNGKYFDLKIKQGDVVNEGDLLVEFQNESIKNEGYSTETILVVTNTVDYLDVLEIDHENHDVGDDIIKVIERKGDK